ncbi:hypothetical protein DN402_32860 [Streptomyces sp. SW4]|nr:hypothetical protein DN402_32860 [Streptomyces sp. SW4]
MHEALLGRDELLADALSAPAGVLVHGSAGIGKTAVLEALADRGRAEGHRVLRAGPARAEQDFPHVALMDLFGALLPEAAGRLAPALRQALESALLRGEREAYGPAADPLAVRVAVVELLRLLAGRGPVLVLIDDAQWLDAASRDVLAFAARRADPQVRVMVTERTGPGEEPSAHGLCPPPVTELALPGLSLEHTGALLRRRLGVRLPAPTVRRVHRASAGNALFALELGRALVRQSAPVHPGEPLPVPRRLRTLLADRLAGLPAHARGRCCGSPPRRGPASRCSRTTARP